MQEKQVAVLIDGDNISPKYAEYIKQEAAYLGRIKIFRLYGSIGASTVKSWYNVMPKYGITPMLQINYVQNKSIADQALTIDAMDILHEEAIDIICLVSSDSDFTKLAYRIKESGKVLIGMGEQKANEALAQACDEFKVLDLIYNVETEAHEIVTMIKDENQESEGTTISVPTEDELVNIIFNLLDDDWENLASVGIRLKKQIPGFDTRIYGYRNVTLLMKKYQDMFEVKDEKAKDGIHTIVYARRKVEE